MAQPSSPIGEVPSGESDPVPAASAPEASAPQPSPAEIEREAFASGYAQGERAGFEAGQHRAEAMLHRLEATLEELTALRRATIAETERQMVELALAIARRIVGREVTIDHDLVVTIARVALERLGPGTSATILLNPEDYARVAARHGADWAGPRVRVFPDEGVSRGGCKVESDLGVIDGTVEAQFEEIANELVGAGHGGL
jgi:flagellar assembly protein FliH